MANALTIRGAIASESREFSVGIGRAAHDKHRFEVGYVVSGVAEPVADPNLEAVEFYKASALRVEETRSSSSSSPPWLGVPPALETYRARGHRRLAANTYETHCVSCVWGCRMPVELIIDQWNPAHRKYRLETFCYGPKTCALYRAGAARTVPGRKGMSWSEEDWVDEEATAHRAPDE